MRKVCKVLKVQDCGTIRTAFWHNFNWNDDSLYIILQMNIVTHCATHSPPPSKLLDCWPFETAWLGWPFDFAVSKASGAYFGGMLNAKNEQIMTNAVEFVGQDYSSSFSSSILVLAFAKAARDFRWKKRVEIYARAIAHHKLSECFFGDLLAQIEF